MNSNFKLFLITLILALNNYVVSQVPELETAQTKMTKIWGGVAANGEKANFDFRAGFFPNDYDFIQHRGQGSENYFGSGFQLAATNWKSPTDSLHSAAVYGPINNYMLNGKVVVPITNYLKYKYPEQNVNSVLINLSDFGNYDPNKFSGGTYDQIIESTYKNVLGVEIKRKVLAWSQSFNDNYIIIDVEMTNVGVTHTGFAGTDSIVQDTLRNFYFMMNQGAANNFYSNGNNPAPSSSERPKYAYVWQHYYGGRPGDSLRVFYFYSADDPQSPGDDMGSPVTSQGGRLLNTNYTFYSILHASAQPYIISSADVDDFLQPKVTYIGTEAKIPNPVGIEDPYGNKNYWAISGGFSDRAENRMPNSISGTRHMFNSDEKGVSNFSQVLVGGTSGLNTKNFSSFGPYNVPPSYKLHFVYAVGIAGIGIEKSQEIGKKWLDGTLSNPPNMPDSLKGWLPSNFVFPTGATEMDKSKDRWISMGKDSIMLSAYRAKWNYDHNYQIPQSPSPVQSFTVTGSGLLNGVVLKWKNSDAEAMLNFAGYSIKRKLTNQDTVFYQEIYSSGSEDKAIEHTYVDTAVTSGVPYYYYIQTKSKIDENDLSADPTTRGKILYSSRIWIPNISPINPPKYSAEDMSKIRIVPNPYNINDPLVKLYYSDKDGRQINFYNLPGSVTIKIYTENGDLIKTIVHYSPQSDGYEKWDMLTDSQQVLNSGVYIANFQKPNGEISFQKFIVVR